VHRDVCPSNVLLSRTGNVLLADYNSAASSWLPKVHDMSQAGTKAYMAPERHLARPADARSDQFSFCVALYEALYKQRPFTGVDVAALRHAVLYDPPGEPPRVVVYMAGGHRMEFAGEDAERMWSAIRSVAPDVRTELRVT